MSLCFVTFLGTGNYEKVSYQTLDGSIINTAYAQTAIVHGFRNEMQRDGRAFVFVTPEAKARHWDAEQSLQSELKLYFSEDTIKTIEIDTVTTEEQIWSLFDKIFQNIPEQSELVFDITHAFRSIPFLGIVIINYTRLVKNISLRGIFYGAYDRNLSSPYKIIDLTNIDRLLRWSIGVSQYLNTGNAIEINQLANETVSRYKAANKDADPYLYLERNLANNLKNIWPILTTCRSNEIIDGSKFISIKDKIEELKKYNIHYIKPLGVLYDKIEEIVYLFKKDCVANILPAVQLCIKYNLIQQGITLLQEGIITIVLYVLGIDDFYTREHREAVSRYFTYINEPGKYTHPANEEQYKVIGEKLEKSEMLESLKIVYKRLQDIRNDINHAGFTSQNIRPDRFELGLKDIFRQTLLVFSENKEIKEAWLINVAKSLAQKE
ncbi:MAG: TIGR02221 family CRISPR-associated protein [Spirochaetota bacterium]|jgi:CRISPR-associated Csx2 family protein